PEHFPPAFDEAMGRHTAEIDDIAKQRGHPTFENTITALEKSGELLTRMCSTFFGLTGAHTNEVLQTIERAMATRLAKHFGAIYTRKAIFRRIEALIAAEETLDLTLEQKRVMERYRRAFVRSGANLEAPDKARMRAIRQRLAKLTTQFSQNVLADESGYRLVLEHGADLDGLPSFVIDSAARAALDAGLKGKYVFTLSRSSIGPFLKWSARRDLRQRISTAFAQRGANGGKTDNRAIVGEIVRLRTERARLLGFSSYAAFNLEDAMAKTPEIAAALLRDVWAPALRQTQHERSMLAGAARAEGANFELEEWDMRYYAEKVRLQKYDLDEAALMPYFQLENMIEAAFYVAGRLFGLRFEERTDLHAYHPDVRIWEAFNAAGQAIGLFIGDYFTRPSKSGGAWMRAARSQERVNGEVKPVIVNVLNLVKPKDGAPALLSVADAETLFHEFGHALHGLLSNVTYPMVSGTNVPRDFVELPSQLFEHWLMTPEVLQRFALHAETGEAIPEDLTRRMGEARNFNQGYETVQYLASAIVDLDLHGERFDAANSATGPGSFNVEAFEATSLSAVGMPAGIGMRHRLSHFLHLFSGDGYAAGYYSYLWSETMDTDAFKAFEETGDPFDPATAKRLYDCIYSTGGALDPAEAYIAFRGRMPDVAPLLERRGLHSRETHRAQG
ncbi:MAG: M3 family metallopeptidase, partial [Chitinophagales bacterium]|nr:M3 family metallopeptidase [Hyphomicrobiales bacterium]